MRTITNEDCIQFISRLHEDSNEKTLLIAEMRMLLEETRRVSYADIYIRQDESHEKLRELMQNRHQNELETMQQTIHLLRQKLVVMRQERRMNNLKLIGWQGVSFFYLVLFVVFCLHMRAVL